MKMKARFHPQMAQRLIGDIRLHPRHRRIRPLFS